MKNLYPINLQNVADNNKISYDNRQIDGVYNLDGKKL